MRAKLLTMYMANKQEEEKKSLEHKGSSTTKNEKVPQNHPSEDPVHQHIDQIGEDDAKILSNISTQALSLLILLELFRNDSELIFHIRFKLVKDQKLSIKNQKIKVLC